MSRRNKKRLHRQRLLIIDAHNVCYQDPQLRDLMNEDPERARRAFELRIGDRIHCHIFYDGGPGGEERRQHRGNLSIHYSGQRSADDCISEWLSYQDKALISVVTDDRQLQARVRANGAKIVPVVDFLHSLSSAQPAQPGIDEVPPSQTEVDFWMEQFGVD